MNKGEVLAFLK